MFLKVKAHTAFRKIAGRRLANSGERGEVTRISASGERINNNVVDSDASALLAAIEKAEQGPQNLPLGEIYFI